MSSLVTFTFYFCPGTHTTSPDKPTVHRHTQTHTDHVPGIQSQQTPAQTKTCMSALQDPAVFVQCCCCSHKWFNSEPCVFAQKWMHLKCVSITSYQEQPWKCSCRAVGPSFWRCGSCHAPWPRCPHHQLCETERIRGGREASKWNKKDMRSIKCNAGEMRSEMMRGKKDKDENKKRWRNISVFSSGSVSQTRYGNTHWSCQHSQSEKCFHHICSSCSWLRTGNSTDNRGIESITSATNSPSPSLSLCEY